MTAFLSKNEIILASTVLLCLFMAPVFPLIAAPSAADAPPSLLLSGDLNGTPPTAAVCQPLVIKYDVKNTGTAPVSSGSFKIEIKNSVTGKAVFARWLPHTMGAKSFKIKEVPIPQGAYTISLIVSTIDKEQKTTHKFTLSEQPLTVSAPILVKKSSSAIPRVLLWLNQNVTVVQQAFAEMIVKQAFEENGVYYTTVDTQEDFTEQAMTGEFNILVLFETDELLEQTDWLMDRLSRGLGLVIIGSEDRTRMIAETFGFKFREAPAAAGAMLLLTEESGMGLSGTVPVSGRILQPQKKSAKVAALFAGDKKPAILIDKVGKGRVTVMPFSFIRSALDIGSTSLYGLLLRTAARVVTPENDETGESSVELLVSAPSGPIKARIVETLPPGSKIIWMSGEDNVKNNAILYDLTVDNEPQRLQYVYQIPAGGRTPAFTEVFYECNEKLVSQGKIE
jgi:hypothetical protein